MVTRLETANSSALIAAQSKVLKIFLKYWVRVRYVTDQIEHIKTHCGWLAPSKSLS